MPGQERKYISVLLPLKLDWIPCYSAGPDEEITQGQWVRAVFSGREYSGIVLRTDTVPDTDTGKIKDIVSVERQLPKVSREETRLWEMVADYYLCTLGEVFRAAYPAIRISQDEALAKMKEKEAERKARAIGLLEARAGRIEERILQKKKKLSETEKLYPGKEKFIARLREAVSTLSCQEEEIREKIRKIAAGRQEKEETGNLRFDTGIALTKSQEKIFETASLSDKPVLINGVTGSGKTEIYLKLARETLKKGENVLYLVPEIAVSRQLVERIRNIFGDSVLTFHSEESAVSRRNTADKIRQCRDGGSPYLMLGTRSSLFLPHNRLGLIIVDEEHDPSYKQDSPAPRYNGRDVAVMLSVIHKCRIVMGSATPSLESVFNGLCGKYEMLALNEKFYRAEDAGVEIIDTSAERRKRGMSGSFSKKLISMIEGTLMSGGQVMIFRPRRAFSPVMQCPGCGEILKCPHCNVSLSFHKDTGRMVCHHCGYSAAFSPECPKCGSSLQGIGSGTQKIEEETVSLFPDARIARLDGDTPKSMVAETIRKFNAGETDILIGTQIIAKGFDFPGLVLTVAVGADSLLGLQDFRADEKALQVLEQLRGRCGRRDRQGTLAIQTCKPEHPVYKGLAEGNRELMYGTLLSERKDFGYPPYTRLIHLNIKDPSERKAETMSHCMAERMKGILGIYDDEDSCIETVSGPYRPPVDRVAGNHVRTIRITLKKDRSLTMRKRAVANAVSEFEKQYGYQGHIIVDVDPE